MGTPSQNRRRWKACERRVAEILGGKRVPVTGRSRGETPDIEHPLFSIEVKSQKRAVTALITEAFEQAEAATEYKVPLVVLNNTKSGIHARDYAVIKLEDFAELLRAAGFVKP